MIDRKARIRAAVRDFLRRRGRGEDVPGQPRTKKPRKPRQLPLLDREGGAA